MFKHFRALGIAGLTTLSASQLALAGPDSVLWSQNKEHSEVIVSGIKVAARTISRLNQHRPLVRFTRNEVGGTALVPLLPYEADDRCSPDFDPAPFHAGKGNEVWANFEFVNIDESDRDLLAFAIKADKPGRKDRFRAESRHRLWSFGERTRPVRHDFPTDGGRLWLLLPGPGHA